MAKRGQRLLVTICRNALVLLGAVAIFALPNVAFAIDGYEPMGFRTTNESLGPYRNFPGDHWASDGSLGYCLNMERPSPSEHGAAAFTTYDQGWSWAEEVYNAIAWNGYPNATTIGGYTFDASSARAATQLAIWMAAGSVSDAGIGTDGADYTGNRGETEIVRAAASLKNDVLAGKLHAPRYTKHYYGVIRNGQKTQDMLWVPLSVTITFTKTSADASVTDGNEHYAYGNASYDIYRTSDNVKVASITTDENGHASCSLKPGIEYYALETKAPPGFELSTERIPFTATSGEGVTLADEPGRFELVVNKRDSATGEAAQAGATLEGAEFLLTSSSTSGFTQTATTDHNGTLSFKDIPLGTVHVVETKAPRGYRLDSTVHTYTVSAEDFANGTILLEPNNDFMEHVIAFDIAITKFKDDNSQEGSTLETPAENVAFEIISNTTDNVVGRIVTDKDGKASTNGQWFGSGKRLEGVKGALPYDAAGYRIHEVEETVPDGYERVDDWIIDAQQIADGTTLSYIARNRVLSSRLQIVKIDAETEQTVPLAGFTFQILDKDGNPITQETWYPTHEVLDSFTTDESGAVALPQRLAAGTYTLRETAVQPPYLTAEDVSFTIGGSSGNDAPLVTLHMADNQAKGRAEIVKRCSEDGTAIAGAEFDVVARENIVSPDGTTHATGGQVVGHVVTDEQGVASIDGLYLGSGTARYAFIETKAAAGHILDSTPIPFELTYQNGQTAVVKAHVEMENAPTTVEIHKTVLGTEEVLAGAVFELWNVEDEINVRNVVGGAKRDSSEADNETAGELDDDITLKDDSEVQTFTTDQEGLIRIQHLAAGTYRMREIQAPAGFVTDPKIITFTVAEDGRIEGKDVYVVEAKNDTTKIDISKRDITTEDEVPGAELTLIDSKGKVVDQWVSGEEPHRIERLAAGEYTLRETLTPRGHDVAEDITFTVMETGTVQSVAMYDEPISIEGQLDKRQQIADPVAPNTEENGDGENRADVTISEDGSFEYYLDFRSTSNTWTDEFTVEDQLTGVEDGLADLDGIVTPVSVGDYDGKMNVWFKTDRTPIDEMNPADANATLDDGHENPWLTHESTQETLGSDGRVIDYRGWRLWQESVPTDTATPLKVSDLGLSETEHIVAVRFEYGRVDPGFTTRESGWDRDDLKHEHDDVTDAGGDDSDALTSAIIRMRVTDAYREGAVLENAARVDLYRNGGGDGLEDHDEDRVIQSPKVTALPLPQTGTGIAASVVAVSALLMLVWTNLLRKRDKRRSNRRERSLTWQKNR